MFKITCIIGKKYPTAKLNTQLTSTAILIAETLGPCVNSSATIIQGMEPKTKSKRLENAQ
jgi:hypothetical protein